MAKVSDRYIELIRTFPLRPIRSDAELTKAVSVLNKLLDLEHASASELDYQDVLGSLIEQYERKAYPIEPLEPHQVLAEAIEARSVTQSEVAKATGIPVSTISELLSKKRDFNVAHIEKLCAYFKLSPNVFMQVEATAR